MLTPLDIESKVFPKAFSGYNPTEVKAFLKEVLTHYEKFYKENIELKDKLTTLQEGIQYYKNIESTLQSTLILAEKTAEETKATARQRADQIEKEAQLKADVIVNDAKNEIIEINRLKEELIHSYEVQKVQMKQYLRTQLELTEKSTLDDSLSPSTYNYFFKNIKNNHIAQNEAAVALEKDNSIKPFVADEEPGVAAIELGENA